MKAKSRIWLSVSLSTLIVAVALIGVYLFRPAGLVCDTGQVEVEGDCYRFMELSWNDVQADVTFEEVIFTVSPPFPTPGGLFLQVSVVLPSGAQNDLTIHFGPMYTEEDLVEEYRVVSSDNLAAGIGWDGKGAVKLLVRDLGP